jgi:Domain of unknown function (DUF4864)
MRAVVILFATLLAILPAQAQEPLPAAVQAEIRTVIERQLDALKRDDAITAFGLAAPVLRAKYGTPERFMAAVQKDFASIYRPRTVTYEDIAFAAGKPVQKMFLVGADGKAAQAYFSMEKQANGAWRVGALVVTPIEGRGI